ncbi:hypothetical protein BegalDRAFT_2643 [Beggiatoa alba B18LD]|uniref:DUF403 domain-containing protein n=1 Tax=Beggiatoa alba B18LD TaxID=395493 RepID=I3CIP2_9GAMM|nr:alpha-E domain-containing protein [Beggiatoa alba]EIJ43485.1 hypothetical protein BegalDRAFT_2643 [Beggiatoa alba B18LD]
MLSRVANTVYWSGRYIERVEDTARLVIVTSNLLLDLPKSLTTGWQPLLTITGSESLFYEQYKEANERNVSKFLISDINNPSSILSSLSFARENMRTTRDIVPNDLWEHLNNLYLLVKTRVEKGLTKNNRFEVLKEVITGCQLLTGLTTGTMSRGAAYSFLRTGLYLERADMTTRILDVRAANLLPKQGDDANLSLTPFQNIQWVSVLKSLTAYQMYRQHIRLGVKGSDVLKFLLQDEQFPRAVRYCLRMVESYLTNLPKNDMPLRTLARLQRQVQSADVYTLAHSGLHEFIDELQIGLAGVHDQISTTYFGVTPSIGQTQSQVA